MTTRDDAPLAATRQRYLNALTAAFERGQYRHVADQEENARATFPDSGAALFVIGTARAALGEGGAAAACLRDALALSPALIDGHDNLGVVLGDLGDLPGARQALKRAAVLAPGRAQSYFNLGRVAQTADTLHQASYRRALTLAPSYLEAWYNRGIAQRAARLVNAAPPAAAVRDFKRCAVLNPRHRAAYNNLAVTLSDETEVPAAIRQFRRAITAQPDDPEAHHNLGLALLKNGDFEAAWPAYEWRWRRPVFADALPRFHQPQWRPGAPGRVLLWAEQGLGEELLFACLINPLRALSAELIVNLDARLIPLLRRGTAPDIDYRPRGAAIEDATYDRQISMAQLCQYLRADMAQVRAGASPYLRADPARSSALRRRLGGSRRPIYGLSWRSDSTARPHKSIDPAALVRALGDRDVTLVNLQYGDTADEIAAVQAATGREIVDLPDIDNFNDIDGLAATIAVCDRVITIANVTADLAGGLAKDVRVLLRRDSDWRWGADGTRTPWYPSATLYRQDAEQSWAPVLAALKRDLMAR